MNRQFSAGGLVYRKLGSKILFLLCKSSGTSVFYTANPWCLPKGWLDDAGPDQPGPYTIGQKKATSAILEQTAIREVREEAGVEAKIILRLPDIKFFFVDHQGQKVFKSVFFYLMEYVSDLAEGFGFETSQTKWVEIEEAKILLGKRKGEYDLIQKALIILNT